MNNDLDFILDFTAKDGTAIRLRPVEIEDAFDITTAAQEIVTKGEFIQKEQVRTIKEEQKFINEMKKQKNMYIVAEMDNKVVGIARIIKGNLKMKEHVGVFRTWITQAAQGKGIGNKIMEYTLKWGRKADLHKIWLTVFSGNEGAAYLYKKYGFVEEGVQKDQILINNAMQDEIYMAYFFLEHADEMVIQP